MRPQIQRSFAILALAAAAMAALLAYLPAAGHDQLWLLYVARHVLAGEPLYGPTLLESNPPLAVWLSLVPQALANALHLPASAIGKALVFLLQAALLPLLWRMLRRLVPSFADTHKAALLFAFIAVYDVLPARDLGQRDHLLALLALPYLFAVAARAAHLRLPLAETVIAGLCATLGFALKPHQALVPIALELWLILRHRSLRTLLRPETLLLSFGALIYPLLIRDLTPAYLTSVLPLLRDTYWAFGRRTVPQLVLDAIELYLLLALTLWMWWRSRLEQPAITEAEARENAHRRALTLTLQFAGLAATLAYNLQGTGWYYQQLPALSFTAFAFLVLLLPPLGRRRLPAWLPGVTAAVSLLAVSLTMHFTGYPFTPDRSFPIESPDPSLFAGLPRGAAVATLTTTVDDTVMPAERFGFTIAQRYPHLWMLPAILRNETPTAGDPPTHRLTPERTAQLDKLQHRFMVEDLTRWHPELILVARCQDPAIHCQVLEDRHDDLLAWFRRDPAFANLWQHYRYAGSKGMYDAYRLTEP